MRAHTGGREYPQVATADSGKTGRFDHHLNLTTPFSQPVPCIVFHVPTFFHNHHNQRRKLCTLHNFRRWFMLFSRSSQFSDLTTTSNWTIADCFLYSQAPQNKKQTNCRLLSRECEANGTNPSARQVNIRKFFLEGLGQSTEACSSPL